MRMAPPAFREGLLSRPFYNGYVNRGPRGTEVALYGAGGLLDGSTATLHPI